MDELAFDIEIFMIEAHIDAGPDGNEQQRSWWFPKFAESMQPDIAAAHWAEWVENCGDEGGIIAASLLGKKGGNFDECSNSCQSRSHGRSNCWQLLPFVGGWHPVGNWPANDHSH